MAEADQFAHLSSTLRRLSLWTTASAFIVLGVALVVLLGWILDLPNLKSVVPGAQFMKPVTMATFVLAGLALLRGRPRSDTPDLIGTTASTLILLICGLTLLEYVTGFDFGIDRILFPEHLDMPGTIPGRMSAISAVNFIFFAGARLLSPFRHRTAERVFVIISTAGPTQAYLAILGHAFGAPLLYNPFPATSISPITAVTTMVLFVGVALFRPDIGWITRILSAGTGGDFVRKTAFAVVVGIPVIGWLRLQSETAGFYDIRTGVALFAAFNIIFLVAVIWNAGYNADINDSRRLQLKVRQQKNAGSFRRRSLAVTDVVRPLWARS